MAKKSKAQINTKQLEKAMLKRARAMQTARLIAYASEEIIRLAESHGFQNRTYNLQDSYVWCVYYNGKRVPHGYGFYGRKMASKPSILHEYSPKDMQKEVKGRALAQAFAQSYKPQEQDGWEIVFAACAPYGAYLELRKVTFTVMSQRYDEIKNVLEPYCTVTFEINPPRY